jgi:saccharopine dehydrogenase (NAD+, L-lysine forming)
MKLGIIREGKNPPDNRVALSPHQCKVVKRQFPQWELVVQPSPNRCYTNEEYVAAGITMQEDLSDCDVLIGIKEVPIDELIAGKTYFFFSHTKKKQPYNKKLLQAIIHKKIRLIDYECLTYTDKQRILGFGFFAGIVGAHNGLLTYGKKTGSFNLPAVHRFTDFREVIRQYFEVKLPPIKIVSTGNGRVSTGIVETMNMFDIKRVSPSEFLKKKYDYPVYVELTAEQLYKHQDTHVYHRDDFRKHPANYYCDFEAYTQQADVLLNGVYWEKNIPAFFDAKDLAKPDFNIQVIADITCDAYGSIPINYGSTTIPNPTYGVHRQSLEKVAPYLQGTVDVMAVDNLPNELPRDASDFFGVQLTKMVLPELLKKQSDILDRATITQDGVLTTYYEYLTDYVQD